MWNLLTVTLTAAAITFGCLALSPGPSPSVQKVSTDRPDIPSGPSIAI